MVFLTIPWRMRERSFELEKRPPPLFNCQCREFMLGDGVGLRCVISIITSPAVVTRRNHSFGIITRRSTEVSETQRFSEKLLEKLREILSRVRLDGIRHERERYSRVHWASVWGNHWAKIDHIFEQLYPTSIRRVYEKGVFYSRFRVHAPFKAMTSQLR
jgi:hypothetical protein